MTAILMGIVSIQYANYVDRNSNQQWCELVNVLDEAYRAAPPQTPIGQKLAESVANLKNRFQC